MSRAPLPWTSRLAAALLTVLCNDGLDLIEVADVAGELLRIASERATARSPSLGVPKI
jgi:hypothetical protein